MCKQNNRTDAGLQLTSLHLSSVYNKISTLSFGRLEDIGVIYERVKPVNVIGIDDGYLALHSNGKLRLCGRRRHRVGISKVFVRFKGQLHIPLIIGIMWLLHQIVLRNKTP